jgi:hypothetical protein
VLTISRPSNGTAAESTPRGSPRPAAVPPPTPPQHPRAQMLALTTEDDACAAGLVATSDGRLSDALPIERIITQQIEAIEHCMLVTHPSAPGEVGCLITLRAGPGTGSLALHRAGLSLADSSGSEATTVMSARQCAMFRAGLAAGLGAVNHPIISTRVQVVPPPLATRLPAAPRPSTRARRPPARRRSCPAG